jgi:predicted enzyme related to lactoylglutathione lyase
LVAGVAREQFAARTSATSHECFGSVEGVTEGKGPSVRPSIAWAEVTIDYVDTGRAAAFWSTLLGVPANKQRIDGWYQLAPTVGGPVLNLQPVEEAKTEKTRAHLDFWVDDLATSMAFVEQLGGTVLDQHRFEEWKIAVMADPEGVEFCLVGRT